LAGAAGASCGGGGINGVSWRGGGVQTSSVARGGANIILEMAIIGNVFSGGQLARNHAYVCGIINQ